MEVLAVRSETDLRWHTGDTISNAGEAVDGVELAVDQHLHTHTMNGRTLGSRATLVSHLRFGGGRGDGRRVPTFLTAIRAKAL